jgi:hypothetical protein
MGALLVASTIFPDIRPKEPTKGLSLHEATTSSTVPGPVTWYMR